MVDFVHVGFSRVLTSMEDFQISVDAEEKALQDGLLGFFIRWVYGELLVEL